MNNIYNPKIKQANNKYISKKRGHYSDKRIIDIIPQRKSNRIIEKYDVRRKQSSSDKESSLKISISKDEKETKLRVKKDQNDIFDINNFIVNSNPSNIIEKRLIIYNVPVPKFVQLDEDYYDNIKFTDEENTSDEYYEDYHTMMEENEILKKENFFQKKKIKKC